MSNQTSSDLHAEDCDNTDVGGLTELHGDKTVRLGVPVGSGCGGDSGAIILLDDASHHILEFLVKLGQVLDARLDDLLGPLVNLLALVLDLVGANHVVYGFLSDALHVDRVELVLVLVVGHSSS